MKAKDLQPGHVVWYKSEVRRVSRVIPTGHPVPKVMIRWEGGNASILDADQDVELVTPEQS